MARGSYLQPLRDWQQRAADTFETVIGQGRRDFLCVATPGAGKTTFALHIAHRLLCDREVQRVVVVVPTSHLREQWAKDAGGTVELDPKWGADKPPPPPDTDGVVVTYQSVYFNPDGFRRLCSVPTLVILDEIHHLGSDMPWGSAVQHAFEMATYRLALSGTPFRTDQNPIPFVRYAADQAGKHVSVADAGYSYGEALSDDVCRPVLFPSYEGRLEWLSRGQVHTFGFRDEVPTEEEGNRLRAALDLSGDWLPQVLREADQKLTEVRKAGHHDAGGLVIAREQYDAKQIADFLTRLTGERAEVAISEDPEASDKITTFAAGARRWIVAVKMISEGVDIKRLRVGVYATHIETEMFFRQVVGRFVRMIPGVAYDQSAYLFIPHVPRLVAYAEAIKQEREHALDEIVREAGREQAQERQQELRTSDFTVLDAEAIPDDVIYDGERWNQPELAEAKRVKRELGIPSWYDNAIIAAVLRHKAQEMAAAAERLDPAGPPRPPERPQPVYQRKQKWRKACHQRVARLNLLTGVGYAEINAWANRQVGCTSVEDATEEQLQRRFEILNGAVQEAENGRNPSLA